MISPHLLDDIRYGWLLWKNQRLRWFFLALAWGLFSGLLTVVVQLASDLSLDRPQWAGKSHRLVTASYSLQGQLLTSQGNHLDLIASLPQTKNYSKYAISKRKVLINGTEREVSLLFYDSGFFNVLEPEPAYRHLVSQDKVYASASLLNSDLPINLQVRLGEQSVQIMDILPETFDRFGGKVVDIYLPLSFLSYWFPFRGENATETRNILDALPLYHAVFSTEEEVELTSLQRSLQHKIDNAGPSAVSINLAPQIELVQGVELYPQYYKELMRQLLLLSMVLFSFGLMLVFNYFSVVANQAVNRCNEFSLKHALGANLLQQLRHLAGENLLFLCLVIINGSFFAFVLHVQLYQSQIYRSYFGSQAEFLWQGWFLIQLFCLLLIIFLSFLPVINLLRHQHFNRGRGGLSRFQRLLLDMQFILQAVLMLCSLNFSATAGYQEWAKHHVSNMKQDIYGFMLSRRDGQLINLPDPLVRGELKGFIVSDQALIRKHAPMNGIRLAEQLHVKPVYTDLMFVSDNFFSELETPWLIQGVPGAGVVVINRALAEQLEAVSVDKKLIGRAIQFGDMSEQKFLTIVGIVENMPHAGTRHMNLPMMYRSIQEQRFLSGPIYLYQSGSSIDKSPGAITGISDDLLKTLSLGTLSSQLRELDSAGQALFFITIQIMIFILLLLFVGMYYQIRTQLWNDSSVFGLQLALGQPFRQLIFFVTSRLMFLNFIATLLFLFVMATLKDTLISVDLRVLEFLPLGFTAIMVAISMLTVCLFVLYRLTSLPIRQLMATQN